MRALLKHLLAAGTLAICMAARADIYVIVHASNSVQALTQKEVVDIFMGRRRAFSSGVQAQPFDLQRDSAVRANFYRALLGMSLPQVNSYWARLMFTGQTLPPKMLASEEVMEDNVRFDREAVGYLSRPPTRPGVRVVLVLKDGAESL